MIEWLNYWETLRVPHKPEIDRNKPLNCEEVAQRLGQTITERYKPEKPIIIAPMSATIGTYAGEGGLMINC